MPALIPDYFERDLVGSVQVVAQNALANADVHSLAKLSQEFQAASQIALVTIRRTYNAMNSRQQRLPNELWCLIWEFLPLDSVIAVSRVCHAWRSLSISTPRLWCALSFNSYTHCEDCGCTDCRYPDSDSDAITDSSHAACSSNVGEVAALLPRSHPLPFTLDVDIYGPNTDEVVARELADAVAPHAQRMAALNFVTEDYYSPISFFPRLSSVSLPMLRSLVVQCSTDADEGGEPLDPGQRRGRSSTLSVPALRRLSLTGGIGVKLEFAKSESLTTLHCPYAYADQVLGLLRQLCGLQKLELRCPDDHPFPYELADHQGLKDACVRVPSVEVLNISDSTLFQAQRLLDTRYQQLKFSFTSICQYDGLCVLATVPQPTWLSVLLRFESEQFLFSIGDGTAERTLSLPVRDCLNDSALASAWDAYPAPLHAPVCTVDMTLLSRIPKRVAAMVTSLLVELSVSGAIPRPDDIPPFPALETLEFIYGTYFPPAYFSEAALVNVAQLLLCGAGRKLKSIVIPTQLDDGENGLFSGIADVVRVAHTA